MDGRSSTDLWQDHESGDPEALNRLVERVYERLLHEVDRRLREPRHVRLKGRVEAEDICNEILGKAMARRKLAAFFENKNATFLSWLIGFIDRELSNFSAKRSTTSEVSLDEIGCAGDAGKEPTLPAKDPRASQVNMRREMAERLRDAVDGLPAGQRAVVSLRHFDGLTFDEIAKVTGKPTAEAAWQAYSRAIDAIRKRLEGGD